MAILKTKLSKILTGILVPTVLAGTTVGIVFAVRNLQPKEEPEVGDYTITFDPGEGQIAPGSKNKSQRKVYANTVLNDVKQPEVVAQGKVFVGWVDQLGNEVPGIAKINSNITLKAKYVANGDSSYNKITFSAGTTYAGQPVVINGNSTVAIRKGYKFFMINKPSCTLKDYYFKGWTITDGGTEVISETHTFTGSTTLYPVFVQGVKIYYDPNPGTGETIEVVSGNPYAVSYESNPKFSDYNQPVYKNGTKLIKGWYWDKACTSAVQPTHLISDYGRTVYAGWVDPEQGNYVTLRFYATGVYDDALNGRTEKTIVYTGNTIQATIKGASADTWANTNKPAVDVQNEHNVYKVAGWEYNLYNPTSEQSEWKTLTDSTVLAPMAVSNDIYIRPILARAVTDMEVIAPTTIKPGTRTKLYCYTGILSSSATYTLTSVPTSLSGKVSIVNDELIVDNDINIEDTTGLTVGVYAKIGDIQSETKTINFKMPYQESDEVWVYVDKSYLSTSTNCWATISMDSLCCKSYTTTPDYTLKVTPSLNGTTPASTVSKDRTSLTTENIYIGDNVKEIPDKFMAYCTTYNGLVKFAGTNIKSIGNWFMYHCMALTVGPTIPEGVLSIGDDFMANCVYMVSGCALPSTLLSIGERFLWECLSFKGNDLVYTIPTSVASIGQFFMHLCYGFGGEGDAKPTLVMDLGSVNGLEYNVYNVSSDVLNAPMVANGFYISGSGADKFLELYPSQTEKGTAMRKVEKKTTI